MPIRIVAGLVGFCLSAPFTHAEISPAEATAVARVFSEWDGSSSPGCALGVFRDGRIVLGRGYGMANLEHGIAISSRSVFRIGSTSKQFTAAAVALLAEAGKLGLGDDVRTHLPELPDLGHVITIRHLIHHTSGIRDYLTLMSLAGEGDAEYYTDREVLDMLARQERLNFPPGSEYLYSNSGYFLLSQIVLRVSGQSLPDYAREHIFEPLGMRDTHFHDDYTMVVAGRADGYTPKGDGSFAIDMTQLEMVGDGGVFTTVEDLFRWDQNFYANRLGQRCPALIEQLLTPAKLNDGETLDYAFGLRLSTFRGLPVVSHGGSFVGFRADMVRFPEQRLSVACLCNSSSATPSRLARKVAEVFLAGAFPEAPAEGEDAGEEPARVVEVPGSGLEQASYGPEELLEFAGRYHSAELDRTYRVELVAETLVVHGPGEPLTLRPGFSDFFSGADSPVTFHFRRDPEGVVSGIRVSAGRVRNLTFVRRP